MRNIPTIVATAAACLVLLLCACDESGPSPSGGANLADEPKSLLGRSAGSARDLANDIRNRDAATTALAGRLSGSDTLEVGGLAFDIPEGWRSVTPSNTMRAAQLEAGGCTVAVSIAGGSIEGNVTRWEDQFVGADGEHGHADVQETSLNGIDATLVEVDGTFLDGGMTGQRVERPGYTMLAAIIPLDRSSLFLKLTGPSDEADAVRDGWEAFLGSVRPE